MVVPKTIGKIACVFGRSIQQTGDWASHQGYEIDRWGAGIVFRALATEVDGRSRVLAYARKRFSEKLRREMGRKVR